MVSSRRERPPSGRSNNPFLSSRTSNFDNKPTLQPINSPSLLASTTSIPSYARPKTAIVSSRNDKSNTNNDFFSNQNQNSSRLRPMTSSGRNNSIPSLSDYHFSARGNTNTNPFLDVNSARPKTANSAHKISNDNFFNTTNNNYEDTTTNHITFYNNNKEVTSSSSSNNNNNIKKLSIPNNNLSLNSTFMNTKNESIKEILTKSIQDNKQPDPLISTINIIKEIKLNENKNYIQTQDEKDLIYQYNTFSRPKNSLSAPLRTVFLDPEVNNFPKSKTRSELKKKIRMSLLPHPSYDLDKDGYVSNADFKLAKRFDFDGNGVLDPEEIEISRHILAEEFFSRNQDDIEKFGKHFSKNKEENVKKLLNSYSFTQAYNKLTAVEHAINNSSAKKIMNCIGNDQDPLFQEFKYHTDKFDSTAYTDIDRIPKNTKKKLSSSTIKYLKKNDLSNKFNDNNDNNINDNNQQDLLYHNGSRQKLLLSRKDDMRKSLENQFLSLTLSKSTNSLNSTSSSKCFKRINLITNVEYENS